MGRVLKVNVSLPVRLSPYIDQRGFAPCKRHQPVNLDAAYSGWRFVEDHLGQEEVGFLGSPAAKGYG